MQEKHQYNEERIDLIVGVIVIVMALALFGFLIVRSSISMRKNATTTIGDITTIGETRRGSEQIFTYELDTASVGDGDTVTWTVNGEQIYEGTYTTGEVIKLAYTPQQTGKLDVVAKVGKCTQMTTVEILAPRLTVSAPNVTIVYGESLPELSYTVSGFVDEEGTDFCYDGACVYDAQKLNVGVYEVKFDKECNYLDYETEYIYGTLTVLPKQLEITGNFRKVYDSTNTIENPDLQLVGVVEGDEVCAECDALYFDNKNVGCDKTIMLANVCLIGEDSCNYLLPDYATGEIAAKTVNVVGLRVKNKLYDGTTKATIEKMGTLVGIVDGDSVAIGNISVNFDEAGVGMHNIVTNGITLIGADKDNYVIGTIETPSAEIGNSSTFWDKIFDREPIAQGAR